MRFPGESLEYREARDRLLDAEMELRRATEAAAAARRALPPGGVVPEDYAFEDAAGPVRLSELFEAGRNTLVIYNFMFAPDAERACPSCTSIIDALDGVAPHFTQRASLAVVAKAPLARFLAHARERGWRHVRLLSSGGTTYNRDYFGETAEGFQLPMLNVFVREGAEVRHFWGTELRTREDGEGEESRDLDFLWPLWSLLDVTPDGRGADVDFPKLDYQAVPLPTGSVSRQPMQHDIFERLSRQLLDQHPEDEPGRMLQSPGLKIAGRFYAFTTTDDLVVKLPEARVRELIATGAGRPCDPRGGRPMREWVRLRPADYEACAAYVLEARDFVASHTNAGRSAQ